MRAALGHTASGGVFTRQQREISILTIRTGCVGGTTRVCRVRVCLPVCALISHSAAVGGKVKVKGGETSGRQSGASLKVRAATQRDCCDLNFKIRIVIFFFNTVFSLSPAGYEKSICNSVISSYMSHHKLRF